MQQRNEAVAQARALLLRDAAETPDGRRDRHARLLGMVTPDDGVPLTETRNRDDIASLREVLAAAARWQSAWCGTRGLAIWRQGPEEPWIRVMLGSPLVFGMINARQDAAALVFFNDLAALDATDKIDNGRRDFLLGELVALASCLRLEPQADAYLTRLIQSGRRAIDGAIAQLATQGDWRRAERLLDAAPGRPDLLVTLIERLAPASPTRAQELLNRLEKATPRAEDSRPWCQAARAVSAYSDALTAQRLAQRVRNGAFRPGTLALAGTRQPDPKQREALFNQAIAVTDRRQAGLRARICTVAFGSDPKLGKALSQKTALPPDAESAFWLARIDPAQARKLIGAIWTRSGVSENEKAECVVAMAPLDPNRAFQMVNEMDSNGRERRMALLALCRYLFLTDAERKIVPYADLFDYNDPLPTLLRGW
ncbi:MAG: hypothetical protein QM758_15060 [Armatimonas sp.]